MHSWWGIVLIMIIWAAKNVGIDAIWIENPVSTLPDILPINFQKIIELSDVLSMGLDSNN